MRKKLMSLMLMFALFVSLLPSNVVFAENFDFENATDELLLYGDASRQEDGTIELTPLKTWCSGSVWYDRQVDSAQGFSVEFNYWAGGGRDDYYKGADGIVLTLSETTGIGADGEYLGFVEGTSCGIELDSYPENPGDPDGKHLAIIQGKTSNHINYVLDDRVDDSEWHNLKVEYANSVLTVWLDNGIAISQEDITLPDNVYLGISAATGSGYNRHLIREFYITGHVRDSTAIPFYYASGSEKDYTSYFFYDDAYFAGSAYDYQSELATMSMCMALSAFGSNRTDDYTKKSQNLKDLLMKCGFPEERFDTNKGYTIKPQTDTIGVGASYKTITDGNGQQYTLIATAVRGGGYESEWASNFTLGESGTHKGFTNARDQVLNFLKEYIAENNISGKVKVWIAGYSRAAATTNMVAGSLDDGFSLGKNIVLEPKDIYAFCFESPQGALKSDKVNNSLYHNIFYIINPVDIVTKVAPTEPSDEFGFSRYGKPKYLPTHLDGNYEDKRAEMLKYYNSMASTGDYIVDDFQMKKISVKNLVWDINGWFKEGLVVDDTDSKWDQQAFLDASLFQLFSIVKSRKNYVEKYEDDIREICSVVFGTTADKWDDFQDYLIKNLKNDSAGIVACVITAREGALINRIENDLVNSLNDAGITDYSINDVKSAAGKLATLLLKFGVSHPNYTTTMISNIKGIGEAHYPELCLAWLMSFDPNYLSTNAARFGTGAYRVLRINCPVDVKVYDNANQLVAQIRSDKVNDDSNDLVCYVNEEGEKLVYLPFSEDYAVEMNATDNGTMDYSISEYSELYGGVNRVTNYYDLPLVEGDSYKSEIPAVSEEVIEESYENGSDAVYSVLNENGTKITADIEIRGDEVADSTYTVEVEANDPSFGNVIGNGVVIVGGYVQVSAEANEGYNFNGWYKDGKLVSSETDYRFLVKQDTKLIAQFGAGTDVGNSSIDKPSVGTEKTDHDMSINIKNKKTYSLSQKITIKDTDGIKNIVINKKAISVNGKVSHSFKLSKYKKYLKLKGKWNKIVVTDVNGRKKMVKFKVDQVATVNIKNNQKYSISKRIKIKDKDGIKTIVLNNKKINVKKKQSFSLILSNYKKYLKKKGKTNKIVITDVNNNKKTVKFKIK